MIKVSDTKGLYYKIVGKSKTKTYFYRYQTLENGTKKDNLKKLSTSLVTARKMIPFIDSGLSINEAFKKVTNTTLNTTSKTITVQDLWELFLNTIDGVQSIQEVKTKKSRFKNHILPYKAENDSQMLGSKDFTKLTYSYFQSFINHLDKQNSLNLIDCSRKTQDNIKASLQALYSFAQKEGLYKQFNPLTHVTVQAYDNHKELLLTNDEILSLYQAIKDMPVEKLEDRKKRLFFIFMIHGRRKSETLKIKWTDINFLNKEYIIQLSNSKSRKTQYLKMTDWLYQELLDLKTQIDTKDFENYIFLNPQTDNYYTDFSKLFKKIKSNAGITSRFTIHEFRHILGTIAVRQLDKKLHVVGEALTHGSDEVTKIYVNKTSENSKLVVDDVLSHIGLIKKENSKKEELKETLQKLLELID